MKQSYITVIILVLIIGVAWSYSPDKNLPTPQPLGLITHPINIGKHANASLTQVEAGNILGDGSQHLSQCNATFRQNGAIRTLGSIPSVITSSTDMSKACAAGLLSEENAEFFGVPRKLQVVNAIYHCGETKPGIIGCAYTPGQCMVVVRYHPSLEGTLLAHEFGHSKGLPHRVNSTDAIMYPSISPLRKKFTGSECNKIRQLGFMAEEAGPPQSIGVVAKLPIEDFARSSFPSGIEYQEARQYTATEVAQIEPWLSDRAEEAHWSNVATILGIVAAPNAYSTLNAFIFSPGNGKLSADDYRARASAIMSMGYILKAGMHQNTLDFLNKYSTPSEWNSVQWMAPYHASTTDRNAELAAMALLALGIGGQVAALENLETQKDQALIGLDDTSREMLNSALQQALQDAKGKN
ncbi:hypothetical protein [Kordiimonas sp.]|uniref:hypothetical protein n=1 Tax=Kordiimonas sp. TaxID=1970157 RepID=UPI003A920EA3